MTDRVFSMKTTVLIMTAVLFLAVLAPRRAAAEPTWIIKQNEKHGKWNLTPTASLMPMYFAPGLRFGIPVAKSGFLPMVNDEVKIELGFNFQIWWHPAWGRSCPACYDPHYDPVACRECRRDYVGDIFYRLSFPVFMRWEFYFTRLWSVYAGFGFEFGVPLEAWYRDSVFGPDDWLWVVLVVGNRLTFKDWFGIRFEIGTMGLLVFGIDFMFG